MLFWYFLKKLYIRFFFFFIGTTLLLASGDLFARMASLSSGFLFFMFAMFMLPLMVALALPIASCSAVATTVSGLFIQDEILLLRFLPQARKALFAAVFAFSCTVFLVAVPLLFLWVPECYWRGKQFLVTAAYHHLDCLQTKKWHKIVPGFSVRFFDKEKDAQGALLLKQICIRYREKGKASATFIFAHSGRLEQGLLKLLEGVCYMGTPEQMYSGNFKTMSFNMAQFSGINNFYKPEKGSKFLISSQLWQELSTNISSFLEYHKRCSQLLWNLLLPLCAFWFMISFATRKSNIIRIITFVAGSFLLFYFSTNLITSFQHRPLLALSIVYGIPILFCCNFLVRYKKQW